MTFRFSVFLLCAFLLTGCFNSWVLPRNEVSLESFVPDGTDKKSQVLDWQKEGKTFREVYFPQDCEWERFNRVVDGDTIVVNRNTRVRMIGIDTPESAIPDTLPEPLGPEAADYLKGLLADQDEVCLLVDPIGDKKDKYKRLLRYVFTRDGLDVNGAMIEVGFARGYYRFPFIRKEEFKVFEKEARRKSIGIWGL